MGKEGRDVDVQGWVPSEATYDMNVEHKEINIYVATSEKRSKSKGSINTTWENVDYRDVKAKVKDLLILRGGTLSMEMEKHGADGAIDGTAGRDGTMDYHR
jgi:hypothetical protein